MKQDDAIRVPRWLVKQYGPRLGAAGLAVYLVLCADEDADELPITIGEIHECTMLRPKTIVDAIKVLVYYELISVETFPEATQDAHFWYEVLPPLDRWITPTP